MFKVVCRFPTLSMSRKRKRLQSDLVRMFPLLDAVGQHDQLNRTG